MIEIKTGGEALDLPTGFSIEIEDSNPIFNERGSQSVPATVPATRRNCRLLAAPHRIDTGIDPNFPEQTAEVVEGPYIRRGLLNITEAGKKEGITFNVGFDNSTAYAKWQAKKLAELDNLPTYIPKDQGSGYRIDWLLDDLYRIYERPNPQTDDFAVFPVAVNNESTGTNSDKKIYWEVLNLVGEHGLSQPGTVKRLLDGEITDVSIPEGYMVTPFLRVWRVLELIFEDIGVTIVANPFKYNTELARLVVLNNAADSVCRAEIKYSDLMPDSTVEEFLNALYVRFGFVYNIDNNTGTARLDLLRDIINSRGGRDLTTLATGPEKITYNARQYVKLSANTSIEGAAPSHERFEDFVKGLSVGSVRLGSHVSQWQNVGTQEEPKWDGDVYDDYFDPWEDWDPDRDFPDPEPPEPDYPEPDDDRDDGRDDYGDYYAARSAAAPQADTSVSTANTTFLAREFITGMWYRLDATNGKVRLSSSSFFNWDPQPEGLTPLELSSDDEFVPIDRVNTVGLGVGHYFNDKCPVYLFGARHYHSYIKGSDETENTGESTPLAFMFAYTKDNKTFGRLNPEGDDGLPITLDDGTKPTLSLLFQFKDGLFAQFWADYDEILRHGNRSVEINARVNKSSLSLFGILDVYTFKGIRCLIDTMTYSLPSGRNVSVDMKLRTILPHGKYDIKEEQKVPDFSAGTRHLEWRLLGENYGPELDTYAARRQAANNYISCYEYEPHGTEGDYWCVDANSAVFKGMSRVQPTWQNDSTIPAPTGINQKLTRKYKAHIFYDIYEIHDMTIQGEPEDWERDEIPIGEEVATVEYTVVIAPKWVAD